MGSSEILRKAVNNQVLFMAPITMIIVSFPVNLHHRMPLYGDVFLVHPLKTSGHMKTISNLNEALVYLLRRQYDAENMLKEAVQKCSKDLRSEILKAELLDYADSTRNKIIKLERAFNYLMKEPTGERNVIVRKMINDTHEMLKMTKSDETRDVMVLSCIQSINQYKMAVYRTSLAFAIELQLDAVSDFLHDIIEWERKAERVFSKITLEFNFIKPQV